MMNARKRAAWACALAAACAAWSEPGSRAGRAFAQSSADVERLRQAEFVTAEELKAKFAENQPPAIIDVRPGALYAEAEQKIKGAIRIRLRRIKDRLVFAPLKDLPRDKEVVTYCACPEDEAGIRAAEILRNAGFTRVRILKGGWQAWLAAGGPIETRPKS